MQSLYFFPRLELQLQTALFVEHQAGDSRTERRIIDLAHARRVQAGSRR